MEVARQRNAHDCRDAAAIERLALHNDHWSAKPRTGSGRRRELGPADVRLRDYQSLRSNALRDAAATNPSSGPPRRPHVSSSFSTMRSGSRRAMYSAMASLDRVERCTPLWHRCRACCATSSIGAPAAPPARISRPEATLLFSYQEYDHRPFQARPTTSPCLGRCAQRSNPSATRKGRTRSHEARSG